MTQSDLFCLSTKNFDAFCAFDALRASQASQDFDGLIERIEQEEGTTEAMPLSRRAEWRLGWILLIVLINLNQVLTQCLVRLHTYVLLSIYVRTKIKEKLREIRRKSWEIPATNQLWLSEGRVLRVHGRTKCQFVLRERRIESTVAHSPRAKDWIWQSGH